MLRHTCWLLLELCGLYCSCSLPARPLLVSWVFYLSSDSCRLLLYEWCRHQPLPNRNLIERHGSRRSEQRHVRRMRARFLLLCASRDSLSTLRLWSLLELLPVVLVPSKRSWLFCHLVRHVVQSHHVCFRATPRAQRHRAGSPKRRIYY